MTLRIQVLYLASFFDFAPCSFSAVLSEPARRIVIKHSGELGLTPPAHAFPCSEALLADYAVRLAVGPAVAPACYPVPGKGLWPRMPLQFSNAPAIDKGTAVFRTNVVRQHTFAAKSSTYFAHLYVVQSTEKWCPHPCMSPTWELAAPKPETGSPYLLLEAAIWRQTRTVALYQFDAAWERRARASATEFCKSKSWGCPGYAEFRESRKLLDIGPWPTEADANPDLLSSFLREAFIRIFDELHRLAGPKAHVGLTYSGHGGQADGSLFAHTLLAHDSAVVLRHAANISGSSGRVSLLNFAGNCAEGHWNMLDALHPFADWILASDLEVGGLVDDGTTDASKEAAVVAAMTHLQDVAVLKRAMENRTIPEEAVQLVIDARHQLWEGEERSSIARQRLRQSLAGLRSQAFPGFKTSLRSAFWAVPGDLRLILGNFVEDASCDVLTAVRLLDGGASSSSASMSNVSMKLLLHQGKSQQHSQGQLETFFRRLRPFYASTRSLFTWDTDTNGLGFNLLHQKCDLMTAMGDSPPR